MGLELKATERDRPTALQAHKLNLIAKAGGLGILLHPGNLDNVIELLKHLATEKEKCLKSLTQNSVMNVFVIR